MNYKEFKETFSTATIDQINVAIEELMRMRKETEDSIKRDEVESMRMALSVARERIRDEEAQQNPNEVGIIMGSILRDININDVIRMQSYIIEKISIRDRIDSMIWNMRMMITEMLKEESNNGSR